MKSESQRARHQTARREIIELLGQEELTARDISQFLGIAEKEVYGHLEHTSRSAAAKGVKLIVTPAACLACGYVFRDRKRLTRPGRCPKCKGSHLKSPAFRIG